ncbi:MAG: hypothetical protein ACREM3_13830 [Candidatus Rokuibacteriota bacterium]
MSECKHGLKSGCTYCHGSGAAATQQAGRKKRSSPASRLADKMNDRMTALKRRLREVRGE